MSDNGFTFLENPFVAFYLSCHANSQSTTPWISRMNNTINSNWKLIEKHWLRSKHILQIDVCIFITNNIQYQGIRKFIIPKYFKFNRHIRYSKAFYNEMGAFCIKIGIDNHRPQTFCTSLKQFCKTFSKFLIVYAYI